MTNTNKRTTNQYTDSNGYYTFELTTEEINSLTSAQRIDYYTDATLRKGNITADEVRWY